MKRAQQNKCFGFFHTIVVSLTFQLVMLILIVANAVNMANYTYDQSENEKDISNVLDNFFDAAFTIEMIFKLIGLGIKNYWKDRWDAFDGVIVILSLLSYVFIVLTEEVEGLSQAFQLVSILRLMRILKLARF